MSGGSEARLRVVALVPAYEAEPFLERTLESLAAQSWPGLRVLISDDASRDDTARIASRFTERDPCFELIRQPRRLGWVGNTNALLAAAHGDYLLFAAHDDRLAPDYVARCVEALEANPRAVVAFADVRVFYQDGGHELREYRELTGVESRVERARRVLRQPEYWSTPYRGVFRAWAAQRIGGLRRNLAGEFSADWPWLTHMALLGEAIRIPEPLVEKHYMRTSLSRSWNFSPRHQLAAALACARQIGRARLPPGETLHLYATLARHCLPWIRRIAVREIRVRH